MSQHTSADVGRTNSNRPDGDDIAASAVNFSVDRLRWGPILGGLFAAMATLILLSVLGAAIGMSAVDRNDTARGFGIGAGIWGAVSALIAFFVGGMVSARNAATPVIDVDRRGKLHPSNGLLQGAMVWAVAIPLTTYLAATLAAGTVRTAGNIAAVGANTAASVADDTSVATQPTAEVKNDAKAAYNDAQKKVSNALSGEKVEQAAEYGATAGWGLLISMLLGLGAAIGGGIIGGNTRPAGADRV